MDIALSILIFQEKPDYAWYDVELFLNIYLYIVAILNSKTI